MGNQNCLHIRKAFVFTTLILWGALFLMVDSSPAEESSDWCCDGTVGNADCDSTGMVDLGDLTALIDYLFISFEPLCCPLEANVDRDSEDVVDLGDLTWLIDYLFITFPDLARCPYPFNSPPVTMIPQPWIYRGPHINAVAPGSPVTGISLDWHAFDSVDHPFNPPPFEFEWRLYGPYATDTINDSTFEYLYRDFVKPVFRLINGELYLIGQGLSFVVCDSASATNALHSATATVTCDTVLVDTITASNKYGWLDTLIDVDDPMFADDTMFNRIAASSSGSVDEWVLDTAAIIYDVFASGLSDTTQQREFVLWVRARDPIDSALRDPTPAFAPLTVIDPKFERDVGIIDVQLSSTLNGRNRDSAMAFWERAIYNWAASRGRPTSYNSSRDNVRASGRPGIVVTQADLLHYKVVVITNDNPMTGVLINPVLYNRVFTALEAGVNVWSAQRAPIYGSEFFEPSFDVIGSVPPELAQQYECYFGVEQMVFSGWLWHRLVRNPPVRIEDFIGIRSKDADKWPDVSIDSALLHRRYDWQAFYPWIDSLAALPEVCWAEPAPGADTMFLYQSLYPSGHFLNDTNFNFEGRPVAHRWETSYFRTVHWMFTPLAFHEAHMQVVIDSVLEWLYDPNLTEPVRSPRYETAKVKLAHEDIANRHRALRMEMNSADH